MSEILLEDGVLQQRYDALVASIRAAGSAVVAYSGGVDSSLLAFLVSRELGRKMLALTITSEFDNPGAIAEAVAFAEKHAIPHKILPLQLLTNERIAANPVDRCYYCKKTILQTIKHYAEEQGYAHVMEGQNADDATEYRPGSQAVKETGTLSPLMDAGLTKAQIRELSRQLGLKTWDAPSSPCMATRIPHGTTIEPTALRMAAEAEALLAERRFFDSRVRVYGLMASIEVKESELAALFEQRKEIIEKFHQLGFKQISLNLAGYVRGNLSQGLSDSTDEQKT